VGGPTLTLGVLVSAAGAPTGAPPAGIGWGAP
jgi:hypothetical protein